MSKVTSSLVLLGTALISGGATYILTKAKYEKLLNGDTPKVSKKEPEKKTTEKGEIQPNEPTANPAIEKGDLFDYAKKYNSKKNEELTKPYISDSPDPEPAPVYTFVDEDIFETSDGYEAVNYTLWADGILTDENDDLIKDPIENVGFEAIETFDAREVNGAVYVLNNKTKMKYQILRDLRRFSEIYE